MVIIQSRDFEISTHAVIDWLISLKVPYYKLVLDDPSATVRAVTIAENGIIDLTLTVTGREINLRNVTAYWHRRGKTPLTHVQSKKLSFFRRTLGLFNFKRALINLNDERRHLGHFLNYAFTNVPVKIGNPNNATMNKLVVLHKAAQIGLKISPTLITSSREMLSSYADCFPKLITKSISDNLNTSSSTDTFMFYTEKVTREAIPALPPDFFYSLFQSEIEKKFEVRVFYLKGEFYAMAIFSQNDQQTEVDFRKYNNEKPNRMVRFQLPDDVQQKLEKLMQSLHLDSGSIDLIISTNNDFYFLEVNPVGQFGMVSYPCNYFIERKIAQYLASGNPSH